MKVKHYCLVFLFFFIFSCDKSETILESPEVLTKEVEGISSSSAIVKGEILKLGDFDIIDHGFVLSKKSEPTLNDIKIQLGSINNIGVFQSEVNNLESNTSYFVRSFTQFDVDKTKYGNELMFSTSESNVWIDQTNYPGGHLSRAVSFVVDDELFIGTGLHDSFVNSFYKYNSKIGSWGLISSLPSNPRAEGIGFSVGDYGYVGLGYQCVGSGLCSFQYYNDLWRYDPASNSWQEMSSFPGTPRAFATSFVIGDKAYITGGSSSGDNDLWEYNTLTDSWAKKTDYPGSCFSRGISFSLNGKGYVGFGWSSGTCNDFWEYDPITDTWTQKDNFPGEPRYSAYAFSYMNKGYLGSGVNQQRSNSDYLTDLWEYSQSDDQWTKLNTEYPGKGRINMISEVLDNRIFIGLGGNSTLGGPGNRFDDIWEYIPEQN
ncbi:kelch repeat-containing protein [uncultured Roseivirga sp.]|uniref:Kelch repeat-containing protein n=1 Tax=uncultured Roseivirga sp. TaxID=543088 RepID=UPI0030DA3D4F|tara:strand:- start:121046 stop:122335 length:1290 start_codon:yes stop_codon:yes gene_type:complete